MNTSERMLASRRLPDRSALVAALTRDPGAGRGLRRGDCEEWRDVRGFEGRYQASTLGRVRSLRGGKSRVLAGGVGTPYGHRKVQLGHGASLRREWVHRLILLTFVGPPAPGQIARHLDGDPTNNALSNLAWGTHAQNNADAVRHGTTTRGERNARALLTEGDVRAIRALRGARRCDEVAEAFNVRPNTIYGIWAQRSWRWVA